MSLPERLGGKVGFKVKALVVDDSSTMRSILRMTLRGAGFEVVEAGNGMEALGQLKNSGSVAVALVDWNMPVMNGLDFTKAIRAQCAYDNLRILMVTSETEIDQVTRAMNAGANEYLMKPFSREVLIAKLDLLDIFEE